MTLSFKRNLNSRKTIAIMSMLLAAAVVPASASAGSVHIDVPHIGISLHNSNSHYRHQSRRNRHHNRHHNRRHYKRNNYYSGDNYYTPRTRYYDRGYRSGYNSGYNYGNGDSYNNNYCPTPGYSSRYYRNRGCYSHGDHYHCD